MVNVFDIKKKIKEIDLVLNNNTSYRNSAIKKGLIRERFRLKEKLEKEMITK